MDPVPEGWFRNMDSGMPLSDLAVMRLLTNCQPGSLILSMNILSDNPVQIPALLLYMEKYLAYHLSLIHI